MPAPSNKKKPASKKQHPKAASSTLAPPAPPSFPALQLTGTSPPSPHLENLHSLTSTWLFQDATSDLDHSNIDDLCGFASDEDFAKTPLGILWLRAYQSARKEYDEESKAFYFKGKERGMEELRSQHEFERNEAFLEGYELGKTQGRLDEQDDWYGSTDKPCCHAPVAILEDAEVQTDTILQPVTSNMAIQVSTLPHTHSASAQTDSPSTYSMAVQAIPPTIIPASEITPAPIISTISPNPAFDWAEDASSIPIVPFQPVTPPPRDLSILRSTNPNPFGSLAHRGRQSRFFQQPESRSRQSRRYIPQTSHRPSSFRPQVHSAPRIRPLPSPALSVTLDWESDPRLLDLGRALKALGWVRS